MLRALLDQRTRAQGVSYATGPLLVLDGDVSVALVVPDRERNNGRVGLGELAVAVTEECGHPRAEIMIHPDVAFVVVRRNARQCLVIVGKTGRRRCHELTEDFFGKRRDLCRRNHPIGKELPAVRIPVPEESGSSSSLCGCRE